MNRDEYNSLSRSIIGAAIEVHRELGPGLLESVYEECLFEELKLKGLKVKRQVELPVVYKGRTLDKKFRMDLVVEDKIVLELKCVTMIIPIHEVQLVTYLKLSNKKLGLLLNFNVEQMIKGVKRRINGYL